jgi:hypothetical protein
MATFDEIFSLNYSVSTMLFTKLTIREGLLFLAIFGTAAFPVALRGLDLIGPLWSVLQVVVPIILWVLVLFYYKRKPRGTHLP